MAKLRRKTQKRLHLGPKMPSFFEKLEFSKKCCHITNQHPEICLIAKFCKKPKMPKFGSKNALFGYFWTRIWKHYCHIENQHPRICLIAKFCIKNQKCLNLGTKGSFLGYSWARIFKKILSYLKAAPSNLYNRKILQKKEKI